MIKSMLAHKPSTTDALSYALTGLTLNRLCIMAAENPTSTSIKIISLAVPTIAIVFIHYRQSKPIPIDDLRHEIALPKEKSVALRKAARLLNNYALLKQEMKVKAPKRFGQYEFYKFIQNLRQLSLNKNEVETVNLHVNVFFNTFTIKQQKSILYFFETIEFNFEPFDLKIDIGNTKNFKALLDRLL